MGRNYPKVEKEIAETGFFSEYLPQCFILNKKVFNRAPPEKCDLIEPYSFTMSRYNNNDARRNIFIPEIGAYIAARNYIKQESIVKEIIEFTEADDASFSPILDNNDKIMRHEQSYNTTLAPLEEPSFDYIENIAQKIIRATGAKKVLKLDISNCFSSFYMHMIPAILLGMEDAETNFTAFTRDNTDPSISPVYRKYLRLDEVIRRQNLNRTNGLLPGPLTSKIIIEGILSRIDIELKEEGIRFSRYIDDYEVYLFDNDERSVISSFIRTLKRYGFSLNYEKTEIVEFPFYLAQNLEKLFNDHTKGHLDNFGLIELFNSYFNLKKNGTKGAIKYLLKSLEGKSLELDDPSLYKSYLLTIIENNQRSITKACLLLIEQKDTLILKERDLDLLKKMLETRVQSEHDLEVIWLLYLLIETSNIQIDDPIVNYIIESRNELAQIMVLRKGLLGEGNIMRISNTARYWLLLYELYAVESINEETFISKLNLSKNLEMYRYLKYNNVHFCI